MLGLICRSSLGASLTCTPGLTGVRGYTWGKHTVWLYIVGGWTTMEGLGWPWGRGGVGVLAGLGWSDSKQKDRTKYDHKKKGLLMISACGAGSVLAAVHSDLCVEPGLELVGIGVQSWFSHLTVREEEEQTEKILFYALRFWSICGIHKPLSYIVWWTKMKSRATTEPPCLQVDLEGFIGWRSVWVSIFDQFMVLWLIRLKITRLKNLKPCPTAG